MNVPALSQMDPQWKNTLLGQDSESTIGKFGCLLTSLAMICQRYGKEETPATLNQKMRSVGGFQGAFIIPAYLPRAVPGMVYRDYLQCRNQPAPLAQIDSFLAAGKPVIVELDYSPSEGLQNHWVVLTGRTGSGDYTMRDPWPFPVEGEGVSLLKRFGFAGTAEQVIQAVLWMDGPAESAPPPPPPPADVVASFPVYPNVDELALRRHPYVLNDNLIRRLAINTRLEALASDPAVRAALGVMNQWLAVRTPQGETGYAAAWYLSDKTSEPPAPPPPTPAPVTPPGRTPVPPQPDSGLLPLIVRAQADGLALRSRPVVADETLIMRLPLHAELMVLEERTAAIAKLGVEGQWLEVEDITKTRGFVAAWYVRPAPRRTVIGANARTARTPGVLSGEPEQIIVRAAAEGLVLRRTPAILPGTEVMRLPLGSELLVLDEAGAPIGKVGAWISVREAGGLAGYVAAWHVTLRPPASNAPGHVAG